MPYQGSNLRSIQNFVLDHPEYTGVIKHLLETEQGVWVGVIELKKENGINPARRCEDFGTWVSFTRRMKALELIETKQSSYKKTWIRVAPNKRDELRKVIEWVKA